MNYTKQMQTIVAKYRESGQPWPAEKRAIAAWAVRTKEWRPQPSMLIGQCADEIARAMREEYFTDTQGRRVRAKHAAKVWDEGKQATLWGDIRSEGRPFLETAFQQRRHQILGECSQLKTDVDSYNQNGNVGESVQIVFDFTNDLAELEAAKGMKLTG
jgi:hypothetical protein